VAAYLRMALLSLLSRRHCLLGPAGPTPKDKPASASFIHLFTVWDDLPFEVTTCVGVVLLIAPANETASVHDHFLVKG
jgi:hypothetical protein